MAEQEPKRQSRKKNLLNSFGFNQSKLHVQGDMVKYFIRPAKTWIHIINFIRDIPEDPKEHPQLPVYFYLPYKVLDSPPAF
jgi:hypothetical protein